MAANFCSSTLGSGCYAHVDITHFFLVFQAWAVITPNYSTNVLIPNDPGLEGVEFGVQTWTLLTDGLLSLDLTNGVFAIVGNGSEPSPLALGSRSAPPRRSARAYGASRSRPGASPGL